MLAKTAITCVLALLASSVAASPHSVERLGWARTVVDDGNEIVPLIIGLRNSDVHGLEAIVAAVSDPDSPSYGQYLSLDEVAARYGPSPDAVDAVVAYFMHAGAEEVSVTASRDFLRVHMSVRALSSATSATFHAFTHAASSRRIVRTLDNVRWTWSQSVSDGAYVYLRVQVCYVPGV